MTNEDAVAKMTELWNQNIDTTGAKIYNPATITIPVPTPRYPYVIW